MHTFTRTAVFSVATFGLAFAGATLNPGASVMASCGQGESCATNGVTPGGPLHGNANGGHLQADFGPVGGTSHSGTMTSGVNEGSIDLDPSNPDDTSTFTTTGKANTDGTFKGRIVVSDPNGFFGGSFQCTGRCTLPAP
jgi:hypothetical protein